MVKKPVSTDRFRFRVSLSYKYLFIIFFCLFLAVLLVYFSLSGNKQSEEDILKNQPREQSELVQQQFEQSEAVQSVFPNESLVFAPATPVANIIVEWLDIIVLFIVVGFVVGTFYKLKEVFDESK